MQIGLGIGIGHNSRRAGGPSYDADAEAYINATGELFPEALNTLVLGIKAAGLWDDHIGSIKKAIGVPNLTASMVDLRNPSFAGTPVNTPTHSATEGWGFTAASSQYIDSGWRSGATDSKSSLNSVHVGHRMLAHTGAFYSVVAQNPTFLGWLAIGNGNSTFYAQGGSVADTTNPATPGHLIGTRTASDAIAVYRDGALEAADTDASNNVANAYNFLMACRNNNGSPDNYSTGRVAIFHAGAGLDATQAATLTSLFDAYATAAGEA